MFLSTILLLAAPAALLGDGADAGGYCQPAQHCNLPAWTPAGIGSFDDYGGSVALFGDTAFVAARGERAVYAYRRVDGAWIQTQRLTAPEPQPGDAFGTALAFDGERLAVGAPGRDRTVLGVPHADTGAVFLFEPNGALWDFAEELALGAPQGGERFGAAVDVDGPRVLVGAPDAWKLGKPIGKAVLFEEQGDGWWVTNFGAAISSEYGSAVAIQGDRFLVGDYLSDQHVERGGSVVAYQKSGDSWSAVDIMAPAGGLSPDDGFGIEIAIDGDWAMIGATGDDTTGTMAGAVHAFIWDSTFDEYDGVGAIYACDPVPHANFGASIDLRGPRLAIGAIGPGSGVVYTFERIEVLSTELWAFEDRITPAGATDGAIFGSDVALGDGVLLAGARQDSTAVAFGGAAYLVSLANELPGGPCPCDVLASSETFGAGKPGLLGVPELALGAPAIPGQTAEIVLSNVLVGSPALVLFGTVAASIPFDLGALLIADPHVVELGPVPVGGELTVPWTLADDPSLCGAEVLLQALLLDLGAGGPYSTSQSKGLRVFAGS